MVDMYYVIPSRWADIFRRVVLCVNFESEQPELYGVYHSKKLSVYHLDNISVLDSMVAGRLANVFDGKHFSWADDAFRFIERVEGGVVRG